MKHKMVGASIERSEIPDSIEPIVGIRGWAVERGQLVSPTFPSEPWSVIRQASCRTRPAIDMPDGELLHDAPHPDCTCGLYAFHSLPTLYRHYPYMPILGIVNMWGTCEVHEDGVRAEWMKICAVSFPPIPLSSSFKMIKDVLLKPTRANKARMMLCLVAFTVFAQLMFNRITDPSTSWIWATGSVTLLVLALLGTLYIQLNKILRELLQEAVKQHDVPIIPYRKLRSHPEVYLQSYGRSAATLINRSNDQKQDA